MLTLLLACSGDVPEDEPFVPTLPVGHCDMEPYTLLDSHQTGAPLDSFFLTNFDLSPSAVDALVGLVGVEGLSPVLYGAQVLSFRYSTQDRGVLQESTGLLAVPTGDPPEEPWPVVLMLHGFAGTFDACAPSRDTLIGPTLPALLASQGFVVIAPDYIGLNGSGEGSTSPHSPLVGEQVAIGSWDAWRAGVALLEGDRATVLDGTMREDVVLWGASQGGHAAVFTELAQPHYAPEADIVAVVAATPAHDLRAIVQDAATTWSDATGLSALALARMGSWYGESDLTTLLTNEEPYFFAEALPQVLDSDPDECAFEDIVVEVSSPEEIFAVDFLASAREGDWDATRWGCFIEENSLSATSIPREGDHPTLFVYGQYDTLIVPPLQEPDHTALCDAGLETDTLQCQDAGHADATLWSLPEQFRWMRERLSGEPWTPECVFAEPACCEGTPEGECG
ncbi:MAG: hypothetical protein GY913_34460 [Proteobacteria bacterium]|nr:hypothetical protein [Pseudomonadota bacterium]MCP4922033.1 hypothetical protein [Pseudomonadota bacterium]